MSSIQFVRSFVFSLLSLLVVHASSASAQVPIAVSPGGGAGAIAETSSCPTFSWSGVDDAREYELAVFEVPTSSSESGASSLKMDSVKPSLQIEIPGGALAWAPSRAQCFESGRLYAWAVRMRAPAGAGVWSDVQLFRVALAPTPEEVEEALGVLRRHRRTNENRAILPESSNRRLTAPETTELPQRTGMNKVPSRAVTTPSGFSLDLSDSLNMGGFLFLDGSVFLHNDNANVGVGRAAAASTTTGQFNVAVGIEALRDNSEGDSNVALGHQALVINSSGSSNVAIGEFALLFNGSGSRNVALGTSALLSNRDESDNTALGNEALKNVGSGDGANTAVGSHALLASTEGSNNTAVGKDALLNSTGTNNIALGKGAGSNATTGINNIYIGNDGGASDNGVIRIGQDLQSKTYIEGISGVPIAGGATVVAGTNDQLGTVSSSFRFKRDIQDLGRISRRILDLRPVSFRYRQGLTDKGTDSPVQYGLIAEEVAEVLPGLVVSDSEGRPYSVRYDLLTPLLVNEVQRQQEEIDEQRTEIKHLRLRLRRLERRAR